MQGQININKLQKDNQNFINFDSPTNQTIEDMYRSLKLLESKPSVAEYEDVTYIPDFSVSI